MSTFQTKRTCSRQRDYVHAIQDATNCSYIWSLAFAQANIAAVREAVPATITDRKIRWKAVITALVEKARVARGARVKLRFRWETSWHPTKPGRKGWMLICNGALIGGVVRYRWKKPCIGYIMTAEGDRDVARSPTPGPAKQRVKAVARALLGARQTRAAPACGAYRASP